MLVATDLDGTLLVAGRMDVPEYTARVLKRVDDAGIPLVFVTARPLRWMGGLWPHAGHHGLAIVSNGAILFDVHQRRILELTGIEPVEGIPITDDIARAMPGAQFAIECADGIRFDPRYPDPNAGPADAPRGPLGAIWDQPVVKLLVRHPAVDPDELQTRVADAVGDRATPTWSSPGLVEISARGVTKADALARLCARLSVDPTEVIAFGDMPNDLDMLRWAGRAFAPANAHPSVRAVVDHIVASAHDEGVAHALESLLAP